MIGEVAALGCGAAWAAISIVMRVLSDRMSPVVLNAVRCAVAAVVLAVLALIPGLVGITSTTTPRGVAIIFVSGVLGQGLGDMFYVWSLKSIGASRALPISSTYPLLTLGLAIMFLGERMSWLGVAGTVLVVGGVTLLAFPHGSLGDSIGALGVADRRGVLAALLAALLWAVSTVMIRVGLAEMDLLLANLLRMATAALLLFGIESYQSGRPIPRGLSARSLVVVSVAGFFAAFSALLYLTSVYLAGAARAAVLSSTAPLFGLPLSLFFLREKVNAKILAGTSLSVAGIWLVLLG